MAEQLETYGSAKLRVVFMDDERGDRIKTDTLFQNLYDFWTSYHDSKRVFLNSTDKKFGNLKWVSEKSGTKKFN